MLQDIQPYEYKNDFAWVKPEPGDYILLYRGDSVYLKGTSLNDAKDFSDAIAFPTFSDLCLNLEGDELTCIYLFSVGSETYFLADISSEVIEEKGKQGFGHFEKLSNLHLFGAKHRAFAGIVGYEYFTWYDTRRFCGRCASTLVHDQVERMMRCPECGCMEFPKLFPAVIIAITHENRVLVSKYAAREYKRYALIAGFSEMGETIEQTVHREVMEEVGLKVKNLRYYKSQPWPFSSSLLMGFFCELDGSDVITLDEHELESAEWLDRQDLPTEDADYSLTRDMMRALREGRDALYPLVGY